MDDQPFMPVVEAAIYDATKLAAIGAASSAEVRACLVCGRNVNAGDRVEVLTPKGPKWKHSYHAVDRAPI